MSMTCGLWKKEFSVPFVVLRIAGTAQVLSCTLGAEQENPGTPRAAPDSASALWGFLSVL